MSYPEAHRFTLRLRAHIQNLTGVLGLTFGLTLRPWIHMYILGLILRVTSRLGAHTQTPKGNLGLKFELKDS